MNTDLRLDGKVALVTGAGSGIGRAAAELFARQGACLGLLDQDEGDLRTVHAVITSAGGESLVLPADVSNPEQVRAAVQSLVDKFNRLDIVFANAGINGVWAPLETLEPEAWDQTLGVNLSGTFFTVKYATPFLKKQGGSVVITSSINGTRKFGLTGATAYASSKAGQVAFAKMTALELAKHKVRVNVICPGWIATNIGENTEKKDLEGVREPVVYPEGSVPLTDGKPGSPEDVARLVLFLASDASSHITGTEVYIDGGETLIEG
ncbi:MAG: SDR family oxidoreductase [Omnitrophica WOR_2 bacterium]